MPVMLVLNDSTISHIFHGAANVDTTSGKRARNDRYSAVVHPTCPTDMAQLPNKIS